MRRPPPTSPDALAARYAGAARVLARRDPVLRSVIRRVGPCTLRPHGDPLTVLVRTIISQQLSARVARIIEQRFFARISGPGTLDQIERLRDEEIRSCGLSAGKIRSLRDLCRHIRDGRVPLDRLDRLTDEELRDVLTEVHGIGPWSVDMFLIFCLGRMDVFPVGDLGLRLGVQFTYGLPEPPRPSDLTIWGQKWQPYRTVATWYMWRSRGEVPQS